MSDKGGGDEDDSQKTEEPTRKKLEDARKNGQVPLSREANTWLMLFTGSLVILLAGPGIVQNLAAFMVGLIENSGQQRLDRVGDAGELLSNVTMHTLSVMMLPFLFFIAAALAGTLSQIGFNISAESIKPSIDKIDPMKGFKRIFSMKSLVEFFKGILKISIVGIVCVVVLSPILPGIESHVGQPVELAMADFMEMLRQLLTAILAALFLLAMFDILYVRLDFNKRMMMTRQEIRDEYKSTEGDPHVKARLRQLRNEKARKRMIQSVPTADVVITNPTHYAVALKYDPDTMDAPRVVAKGVEAFALRIREVAKDNDVMIIENVPLARSLYDSVEVDEQIPENLYKAVAEVISYVFRLKGKGVRR